MGVLVYLILGYIFAKICEIYGRNRNIGEAAAFWWGFFALGIGLTIILCSKRKPYLGVDDFKKEMELSFELFIVFCLIALFDYGVVFSDQNNLDWKHIIPFSIAIIWAIFMFFLSRFNYLERKKLRETQIREALELDGSAIDETEGDT